jgi:hypothetical protein
VDGWPGGARVELARALDDVDRVAGGLAGLLDERASRLDVTVGASLTTVLATAAQRWRPALVASGRDLMVEGAAELSADIPADALACLVDDLIDHVVARGSGVVPAPGPGAVEMLLPSVP